MKYTELMENGQMDQDGFELITLRNLDLVILRRPERRVVGFHPSLNIRTKEGIGKGISLHELLHAHGVINLHRVPESDLCSVTVPKLDEVYSRFSSCEQTCQGESGGYIDTDEYDYFEQK